MAKTMMKKKKGSGHFHEDPDFPGREIGIDIGIIRRRYRRYAHTFIYIYSKDPLRRALAFAKKRIRN